MGILDDVAGKITGELAGGGGGEQSGLLDGILGLLSGAGPGGASGEGPGGGLQGLIRMFQGQGLGDIVSSWVGTGQNLPITGDQLKSGLGSDLIGRLAGSVGLSADDATSKLTELLPTLVDKLTPEGKVPESGTLQQLMEALRGNLPKA